MTPGPSASLSNQARLQWTFAETDHSVCARLAEAQIVAAEHVDVLIVGAGLSGVGAAYHLQKRLPGKSYIILEGRNAIGGTWDLFRYPGVRSDSDMHTLGYAFKPWPGAKAIADGPSIRAYVQSTAAEHGIDRKVRFQHRVVAANWSSQTARWTVTARRGDETEAAVFTCSFLMMCGGYFSYAKGHAPEFPGQEKFRGRIVHPQHWPDDLDYANRRVVVIGSGATAITLVPAMAKTAEHVTMLQRSPTYVVSRPSEDRLANWLRRRLPASLAYGLIRWRNVLLQQYFYNRARRKPEQTRAALIHMAQKELGPDYPVSTHFNPRYNPWDQRLCLIPDSDLFGEIKAGRASIATDTIATFTDSGLLLASGKELAADIVVTATGLDLVFAGDIDITINGQPAKMANRATYRGAMYSGVPNFVSIFGYTNASWTLKCDLTCEFTCRVIARMDRLGARTATPQLLDDAMKLEPWLDFSSGYVRRTIDRFPKQGDRKPWRLNQNYALDLLDLRYGRLDDPELIFA